MEILLLFYTIFFFKKMGTTYLQHCFSAPKTAMKTLGGQRI